MLQELSRLPYWLAKERKGQLPNTHQHCSRCAPECIEKNYLKCALGVKCAQCPILLSLRKSMQEQGVSDEDADYLCALTCGWHIFTTAVGAKHDHMGPDTSEGYVQDE